MDRCITFGILVGKHFTITYLHNDQNNNLFLQLRTKNTTTLPCKQNKKLILVGLKSR